MPARRGRHIGVGPCVHRLRLALRPEDVDVVVNTHLHVDHVGWNTVDADGQWVP
ncbi:MBL fold metallo-hydrolase, partial [Streptomyces hygroscopicus]|uniref:MBL fold metallo-hydrolase n=1 Tax=Streptomyces hygroscopicus TaxID=1912 RepID=UPI0033C85941